MKFEVIQNTPSRVIKGYFSSVTGSLYLLHKHQPCEKSTLYTWFDCQGDVGYIKHSSKDNTPEYWERWGFTPIYEDEEVKIKL